MKNEESSFSEELQQEFGEGKKQSKNILSELFYQHQKLKIKDLKREDPANNPNSNIKKLK
jgi:hypothetical protein